MFAACAALALIALSAVPSMSQGRSGEKRLQRIHGTVCVGTDAHMDELKKKFLEGDPSNFTPPGSVGQVMADGQELRCFRPELGIIFYTYEPMGALEVIVHRDTLSELRIASVRPVMTRRPCYDEAPVKYTVPDGMIGFVLGYYTPSTCNRCKRP